MHLKAILCVCVVFTDPFTSIVEEHVQWKVLLLEVVHKGANRPMQHRPCQQIAQRITMLYLAEKLLQICNACSFLWQYCA